MSSKFLSGGDSNLTDGTAQINIKSATVQDLLPNLPVRTTTGKLLTSGLIQVTDCAFVPLSDPFNGTLHVENIETAYNTTPVDLNAFIASTLTDISTLQSDTQYITASPGLTNIGSNVNLGSNIIKASQYQDPTGSTFIDMSSPGDISVNATTFDFNGSQILTNPITSDLDLGTNDIVNTGGIVPSSNNTQDIGTFLDSYKDIYLAGSIQGSLKTSNVNSIVTGPGSAINNNLAAFDLTTGTLLKDSNISTSSISGGPFLPLSGASPMTGNLNMGTKEMTNISAIRPTNTNVNIGNTTTLAGGGTGQIVIGDFATSTGSSNVSIGLQNIARNLGVSVGKETVCGPGGVCIGYRSQTNQTDAIHIGRDNTSNAISADIIGVNRNNTIPNSLLLGNNAYTNIRANNTCDLGTTAVPFQSVYSNGSIVGTVNSRLTNDIVSNQGTGVTGNIVSFADGTGKIVTNSGVPVSSLSGAPFLPLAGGTMTGGLNMSTQTLTVNNMSDNGSQGMHWGSGSSASNIDGLVIGRNSSTSTDSVIVGRNSGSAGVYGVVLGVNSSSANNTAGNVAIGAFCNSSGDTTPFSGGGGAISIGFTVNATNKEAIAIGSGIANSTASSLLIGGTAPMVNWRPGSSGTCDLGTVSNRFKDAYVSSIVGPTTTKSTDDIFLRTGTVPMTGNLQMGVNSMTNVSAITTSSDVVNIGLNNTTAGAGSVSIGANNTSGGFSGGKSIIYGNNNNTSGSGNGQSIIYGNDNTDSNGAGGSFMFGFGNTNGTGQRNILIGRNNVVPNGVNEGFVMGFANTNSTSNSLLVGGGGFTNIRAGSTICDLGTVANPFKDVYTNGIVKTASVDPNTGLALNIAGANATSLNLGRAAITSTVLGTAVATVASGAWYSTVSFSNAFTAGTNRLVNPALTSNALLSQFTNSLGVLTYTGARTRTFKVDYNISFLTSNSGANMTFWNGINAAATPTSPGTTQSRIFQQVNVQNNNLRIALSFSDIITLTTGQTIQLCALCAATVSVTFDFINCNITGLLN